MKLQPGARVFALVVVASSVILLPWFSGGRDQPQLAIAQIAIALAFIFLIVARSGVSLGPGTFALVVTAGAGAAAVSTLFTLSIDSSFPLLLRWLWLALSAWSVAAFVRFDKYRDLLVFSFIGASLLQVAFSFFIWGQLGSSSQSHYGTFYSPNHYAGFVAMTVPFFLLPVVASRSMKRSGIWAFLAAFVLAGVLLTGSRGGLGAALVAVAVLMVVRFKRDPIPRTLAFVGVTVLLAFGLSIGIRAALFPEAPPSVPGVVESITKKQPSSRSLMARYYWAESAVRTGARRPLTGAGLGTFPYTILADQRSEASWSRSPHNQYLEGWADGGISLLLASLALPLSAFVMWAKNRRTRPKVNGVYWQDAAVAGLVGASAHMLLDSDWQFPAFSLAFIAIGSLSSSGDQERVVNPAPLPSFAAGAVAVALLLAVAAQILAPPLQRSGDSERDAAIAEKASRLMPYSAEPHEWIAAPLETGENRRDAALARDALTRAIARRPIDPGLWWRRAAVAEKMGDVEGARAQFRRSTTFAPYAIRGYLVWGEFELRQSNASMALQLAVEGIKLIEPRLDADRLIGTESELLILKGNAESALGRNDEALHSYRQATVAAPGNPRAWQALSAAACSAGLVEEGREAAANVEITDNASTFVSPC